MGTVDRHIPNGTDYEGNGRKPACLERDRNIGNDEWYDRGFRK